MPQSKHHPPPPQPPLTTPPTPPTTLHTPPTAPNTHHTHPHHHHPPLHPPLPHRPTNASGRMRESGTAAATSSDTTTRTKNGSGTSIGTERGTERGTGTGRGRGKGTETGIESGTTAPQNTRRRRSSRLPQRSTRRTPNCTVSARRPTMSPSSISAVTCAPTGSTERVWASQRKRPRSWRTLCATTVGAVRSQEGAAAAALRSCTASAERHTTSHSSTLAATVVRTGTMGAVWAFFRVRPTTSTCTCAPSASPLRTP